MSFLLPNTENVQLDIILPRIKIRNSNDAINLIAREVAGATFYTAEEISAALADAVIDAGSDENISIPCLSLSRLAKPCAALVTFDEPLSFVPATGPVSLMMILALPQKDGGLNKIRLSRVSRLLKDQQLCRDIIDAHSENEIFAALLSAKREQIAA